MVLELSTSYVLMIICFSKRPVPSAEKKTDVTDIFAGCRNQNFGRCVSVTRPAELIEMAQYIDDGDFDPRFIIKLITVL